MKSIVEKANDYIGHTFETDTYWEARIREAFKCGAMSELREKSDKQ